MQNLKTLDPGLREFLFDKFPDIWIGRDRQTQWPQHSPDITTLDVSFWVT